MSSAVILAVLALGVTVSVAGAKDSHSTHTNNWAVLVSQLKFTAGGCLGV